MHIFTLEDLKKAFEIVKGQQNPPDKAPKLFGKVEEGRAQENMGNTYYNIGQYPNAFKCYSKHLEIAEELGDKGGVGRAHGNLGITYNKIGQYQKAIECHRKDLEVAEGLGDKRGVGRAHGNLGNAYNSNGQYQKAIECHRKNLEIAEELGDKGGVAGAYANLGNAYDDIGQYEKAIECHRKDLKIAEELGDRGGIGRAHGNLGITYNKIGQYQKAIECHRSGLEIAEELGDKDGVARAHANLGNAYDDIGQYEKAIECHSKDLEISEGLADKGGVGRAHGNLGITYNKIGQYQKAIECHRSCLEIAEELGDKDGVARAHANLGNAYDDIGQYEKAIECHSKDLEISEGLADKGGVARAHANLGNTYINISQYQKAIECHRKHLEIAEELGDKCGVGRAHANLGNAYNSIGQYRKAIDCHRKHLKNAEELGDKGGVGKAHANLGNAYYNIGQYQKAIECHRKDLEIAEELGDKGGVRRARANLRNGYDDIGQYQKAIECHRNDLEIAEKLLDKGGVGRAYENMGHTYQKVGQYEKAFECHWKYLEIAEELGDKRGVGNAYGNLGACYYYLGQHQEAIDFVLRGLQIDQEIGNIRGKVISQEILGLFHQKVDDCLSSSFFAQSIISFHSIRRYGIYEDKDNTSLSNLSNHTHKSLFLNLLNLKQVKAALLISDAGKAKALFDLTRRYVDVVLDSSLEDHYTIPIQAISDNPSSKANEKFLDDVLSKVLNLTVQDGSIISYTFDRRDILHAWVVSKKGVFHQKWETMNGMATKTYLKTINIGLRDSLVRNMPKSDSFPPNVYSFETVVKGKSTDELVVTGEKDESENNYARDLEKRIENLMRNNNSEVMPNCDPNFLHVKSVKERYNLDSSSRTQCGFHDSAGRNSEENDNDEKKCLGRYSLEIPNATLSRTRKETSDRSTSTRNTNDEAYLKKQYSVYISPIEEYLVGSKILVSPESSLFHVPFCALLNSRNEHLCERYSIQFTQALHVLNASLSKPLSKVGPAVFVGNPVVGEVEFYGQLISPSPLPNATVEAKECSKFFAAEPLLEENATKENVLKIMKDASIIHIAAHGHMDNADIFLAPIEGAPKPPSEEHYLLTAEDVTKCTLVARLVVLSCCHSGRGQISAEGVVGIARSFLGAGARSVLVTICRIPDEPTMMFMKQFYDKVVQGLSVCIALQRSMIELKKKYPISAWAPFQIVGEDIALSNGEIEEIRQISSIRKRNCEEDANMDEKRRTNSVTIERKREDCEHSTIYELPENGKSNTSSQMNM